MLHDDDVGLLRWPECRVVGEDQLRLWRIVARNTHFFRIIADGEHPMALRCHLYRQGAQATAGVDDDGGLLRQAGAQQCAGRLLHGGIVRRWVKPFRPSQLKVKRVHPAIRQLQQGGIDIEGVGKLLKIHQGKSAVRRAVTITCFPGSGQSTRQLGDGHPTRKQLAAPWSRIPVMKSPIAQAAEPLRDSILDLLRPEQIGGRSASRQALQRLMLLRLLVTILSVAGAVIFHAFSPLAIPVLELAALVGLILLSIVLGFWRLNRAMVISQKELFAHLVMDVVFLVAILFYTGGASNPLISYLLVLLAVGATLFSQLQVNTFALGCVLLYTSFLISELRSGHTDHMMMNFQLHLVGMWVTFVVSAGLITVFVTHMASAIRSRELTLAKARENEMRNEQLVAIGTLAAGTAHALGTPLFTMSVLLTDLDKLDEEQLRQAAIKPDITLLRQQVTRCKDSLNQLTLFYNKAGARHGESVPLTSFLGDLQDYIVNIHPKASVSFV